jgi:hypothetical protein
MILATIGYVFVVLVALYFTAVTLAFGFGTLLMSNEIDPVVWVFASIAAALWFTVWQIAPFTVSFTVTT